MDSTGYDMAAGTGSAVGILLVVIGGLIVVGLLIWAVRFGIKVKQREPRAPGAVSTRRCRTPDRSTRPSSGANRTRCPAPRRPVGV